MMGKQLYKVELTGWVVKEDEDSDVMNWSIEAITNDMVGFEIQATLVDSSGWTHIPIIATNEAKTTTTTITDGQVGINVQDVVTPTVRFTTEADIDATITKAETAMDIELDTKGMSL